MNSGTFIIKQYITYTQYKDIILQIPYFIRSDFLKSFRTGFCAIIMTFNNIFLYEFPSSNH